MADPFAGFTDAGAQTPVAAQSDPFAGFSDNGPGSEGTGKPLSDFWHPVKPEPSNTIMGRVGTVLQRLGQYPRIWAGEIMDEGETLGKVAHGEIDATSPEAIAAARGLTSQFGPAGEFSGMGAKIVARDAARRAPPGVRVESPGWEPPAPSLEAAQTAVDVGRPLPAGITSQTPGVQAFTQGFRQVPLIGPEIGEKVLATERAVGGKVKEVASDLSGGNVQTRAEAGASTKDALQQAIDDNKDKITEQYSDLRNNHIEHWRPSSVDNTKQMRDAIVAQRNSAGKANETAGLADVEEFIKKDRSFDGMIRARSDIGAAIGDNARMPHPGFPTADMKRIYSAMTRDLENSVTANVRPGVSPIDALASFNKANGLAEELINTNGRLARLRDMSGEEGIVGSIINKMKAKSGNLRQLTELRSQLPTDVFDKVTGIALDEMGKGANGFSLNNFGKAWSELTPQTKGLLIRDPAHRKALDDIANLKEFLKDADKYRGTSNTAHAGGVMGALITAAEAFKDPEKIPGILAALAGSYGIGKILGRPASASALRKWLTIARDKASGRYGPAKSAAATSAMSIATRNLANNLPEPATAAQTEPAAKREPLRVTVHPAPKDQGRAPSAGAAPTRRPPIRPAAPKQ